MKTKKKSIAMTCRFPPNMLKELRKYAKLHEDTVMQVLRLACRQFLYRNTGPMAQKIPKKRKRS